MIRYILMLSEYTVEKRGVIFCSIKFSALLLHGKFLALIGLDIQSCEKVCYIFQHIVLGTFMTVSRVLPSYPPT